MSFRPNLSRLQVLLLASGVALTVVALFADWGTVEVINGADRSLPGLGFVIEADYFLFFTGDYGTIYSPLVPLLSAALAGAFLFFDIRYVPTALSAVGAGAVIGDMVKFLNVECTACNIDHITLGPGIFLALAGTLLVTASTIIVSRSGSADRPAEECDDAGEDP